MERSHDQFFTGSPLQLSHAVEAQGFHSRGGADAGARDRYQHSNVQRAEYLSIPLTSLSSVRPVGKSISYVTALRPVAPFSGKLL